MKHYIDQVLSSAGVVISGATVTVRVANATPGTGALANIYTVDSTASPISGSAVTTDLTGTFNFYVPDGRYDLTVSVAGATKTVADVEISDITEANSGDATTVVGTLSVTGNVTVAGSISGANILAVGPSSALEVFSGSTANSSFALGRSSTDASFAIPQANGFFFTNSDLAAGDLAIGQAATGRRIYFGATGNAAAVAVTNAGLNIYTSSGTLPAHITNDSIGGVILTTNNDESWEFATGGQFVMPNGGAIQMTGSTSGFTRLVPVAVASGLLTLPAATDTLVGRATTDTLTNKRISSRIVTLSTSTTFTPDSDNSDQTVMVMTGTAGTLTIAAPTGTPTDGQKLILRIKATNAQTYSFNATYAFSTTVTAPTTLAATKTDYIGCIWDATNTKWDVVAVDQGH